MAAPPMVSIEFEAKYDKLRADVNRMSGLLRDVSRDVGEAMNESASAMSGMDSSTKKAAESQRGLLDKVREFRSEQVQQGRQARFFAAEIASIIPAAEGAKSQVQGFLGVLIEGAAGGLSFGLALEVVKFSVEQVVSFLEAAEKRSAAIIKAGRDRADEAAAALTSLGRALDSINGTPLTETEKAIQKATDDANQKLLAQDRIIQDLVDKGEGRVIDIFGTPKEGQDYATKESDALKKARADRAAMEAAFLAQERQLRERGRGEEREQNEKQLRAEYARKLQWEATTLGGVAAIRKKFDAEMEALANDRTLTEGARETKRINLSNQADREIADYRIKKNQELAVFLARNELEIGKTQRTAVEQLAEEGAIVLLENEQKIAEARRKNDTVELNNLLRIRNETANLYAERIRLAGIKSQFADVKQEVDESAGMKLDKRPDQLIREEDLAAAQRFGQIWQTVAGNIGSAFDSIGTAIGGAAGKMFSVLGKLIQQVIQLAIAWSATSGPLGWLNVAAAAAAIIATISSVPDFRAMGGSVTAGRPYVVGERGPELMVPGQSGTVVPNHKLGGGVTLNVYAMDSKSFEDSLSRHDSSLLRVLRRLERNGRLG